MVKTEFQADQDMQNIIEESFNNCMSNREELYWLIGILRGFMNIKNKRTESTVDNFRLNRWQYELFPQIEWFKHKYNCSTYTQGNIFEEETGNRGGAKWYNNGKEQVFTKECPRGYKPGMLTKKQRLAKKKRGTK